MRGALAILLPALVQYSVQAQAPSPALARPKLIVVISVDQLSAELVQTYGSELSGGLARLLREGVSFTETYHDHGFTETGPGHSVLLSGRFPAHTGIVENRWYDRATKRITYCVEDPDATPLSGQGKASSNRWFLGEGLGDWLQAQVPGSRMFALSGKDRAAILMSGRKPTAAYWFAGAAGFTSSSAYAKVLPDWLKRHDTTLVDRLQQEAWVWTKTPGTPEGRVAQWTFGSVVVKNGALPRTIQLSGQPLDAAFEGRFRRSPFLDAITLEAAEALFEQERLGQGPGTDLLALSFSATDYIGHGYGAHGTEMRDQLHRLDALLSRLLARLERQHPGTWVVLSADHGAWDVAEALAENGLPARRLDPGAFQAELNGALKAAFKLAKAPFRPTAEPQSLYLDEAAVATAGVDRAALLEAAKAWLKARPEVLAVCTAADLNAVEPAATGSPRDTSLTVLLRRSFHPERSGDLLIAYTPLTMWGGPPTDYAATHGSPHSYDRRVPLVFWGPWKGGPRREPVRTIDLAPTLARELGLKVGTVDGKALDLGPRK
jgi:predicted AlkP superfamily pyrophosphatase or phosphodiesterase